MTVGLVIVSHSSRLAEGLVELAAQMAPDVRLTPAGGTADDRIGTDFDRVSAALSDADTGSGVVVVYDVGSAQMTAEMAVEALPDPSTAIVADGPLVEGTIAAATAAQGGAGIEAVAAAVIGATGTGDAVTVPAERTRHGDEEEVEREIELTNAVGLHARPAALLTRCLTGLEGGVTVTFAGQEVDAASVLGLMSLGARQGDRILLRAGGPDAQEAVERIVELIERDFEA